MSQGEKETIASIKKKLDFYQRKLARAKAYGYDKNQIAHYNGVIKGINLCLSIAGMSLKNTSIDSQLI